MKALIRVLKNEKYASLLLFFVLVLNSAILMNVSAAGTDWVQNSGESNFFSITDKSLSKVKDVSIASGGVPALWNTTLNNGLIADKSFSVLYAQCKEKFTKEECDPNFVTLEKVASLGKPSFNSVDALSDINATLLDQRPASGVDYFNDKVYAITHFNTVSAQTADATISTREAYYSPGGTGFSLLKPIQNFWSWSVRVVYGFLLIIVIIIAFAIMFRQRLSGNVEVTVQNAIPAIALAMILVPLSYAISGLFIDFITVGTNAVHEFLIGAPGSPGNTLYIHSGDADNLKDPLNPTVPYEDRGYYPDDVRVDWLRARDKINVSSAFGAVAGEVGQVSGLNGNVIFLAVGSIVNVLTGKTDSDPADFTWVGDIVQFILAIVTLWVGIQIFVHLFKKYIIMILFPVISPFIFATIAIPGNGTKSIMQYAKVMLAAALAFIVTYAMFLLAIIFTSKEFISDVPTFASATFNPPLLGLKAIGLQSNTMTQLLLTLIGLGIYFSIPNTIKEMDEALGAQDAIPKFIKTPIDSFRESQRVMFKTAPALAGRVAGTGARLAGATGAAPFRAYSGARDLADRARGIDPEKDYRSYRNRQRAARQERSANTKARTEDWRASKNPLKRMSAGAIGALDQAQNNLAGQIEGTGSTLPGDVQRPKVEIIGKDIVISRQDVIPLINAIGGAILQRANDSSLINYPAMPYGDVVVGSTTLEFKVTGPAVTIPYPPKLDWGSVSAKVRSRPDVLTYDAPLPNVAKTLEALEYKDAIGAKNSTNRDTIRFVLDGSPRMGGTDTVKQDVKVVSNNLAALFGSTTLNPANFAPNDPAAVLRPGVEIKMIQDIAIMINDKKEFTSGSFKIGVKMS